MDRGLNDLEWIDAEDVPGVRRRILLRAVAALCLTVAGGALFLPIGLAAGPTYGLFAVAGWYVLMLGLAILVLTRPRPMERIGVEDRGVLLVFRAPSGHQNFRRYSWENLEIRGQVLYLGRARSVWKVPILLDPHQLNRVRGRYASARLG